MRKSGLSSLTHSGVRRSYTVKPGDSLSRISKNCYGSAHYSNLLAEANKIPPPFLIRPGQVLAVPDLRPAVQERELRAMGGPKGQGAIAEEQRQGALRKANSQGEAWEQERSALGMVPRLKTATPLSPLPLSPAQREEALRMEEKVIEPVAPSDRRDDEFEPLPPTLERRLKAIP
jgi:LysM repeat protein